MSGLSKHFIESIGVTMDDSTFNLFKEHFEDTLMHRVAKHITDDLDDQQTQQLEPLLKSHDEQAWQWLLQNIPNIKELIQREVDILLSELAENSDHL